ncbi:MAG: agmatinase family protein [Bacteroidota bacterium]
MSDQPSKIDTFDPNGVGLKNGHFIGLPFSEEEANIILFPVPWEVTVSYSEGTATAPANILQASAQLDLYDQDLPHAWKMGLYMRPISQYWLKQSERLRSKARIYIDMLEEGQKVAEIPLLQELRDEINRSSQTLNQWVKEECGQLLDKGKLVGLVGGEHSIPLGYLQALAERHADFGILQIDAHQDLRKAYEGFTYSHASIFYNALQIPQISRLVQVGIRDHCEEEVKLVEQSNDRVKVYYDQVLKSSLFRGGNYHQMVQQIINDLPQKVYISFDIDGLDPKLCPHTGTPVPGGLDYAEAIYLIKCLVESGRQIIGFDLCEVAGMAYEWDGNVGARLLYQLSIWMGKSNGRIKKNPG